MNKICMYAICKNELQFVDKWFENAKEADYVCVLDTGSTDGTFEKLQELVTKFPKKLIIKQEVITPWRFDVARNKSMELVPDDANILICTDFDELLSNGWASILKKKWKTGKYDRAHYKYAWSHTATGELSDIFIYDKIHTKNYEWIFPVHEVLWRKDVHYLDEFEEKVLDLSEDILLEHFQDQTKSRSSYFDLLQLAVQEHPEDPHERMLLAREYLLKEDYNNALEEYLRVLQMPQIDNPKYRNVLLESLGRCADLYIKQDNYDECIWYCQEFIKEDATYREPYYLMAEVYNQMKMYTLAEACILAADKYCTRKYSWIERAPTWLGWRNELLTVTYSGMKNWDEALININAALAFAPDDTRLLKNKIYVLEQLLKR